MFARACSDDERGQGFMRLYISDIHLTMNVCGRKTYALISEYALICDMRLITCEYGITTKFVLCNYLDLSASNKI